jgi:dipeptidyl aminopeptidase/acylaminoacyl peptidase
VAFTALCIAILPGCAGCPFGGSATSMGSRWDIYAGGGSYLGTQPSVCPDGLSVFYSAPATGHGDIYRFDRSTGKNVRLTTYPEYDGYPLVSKDGKHIIFERETNGIGHLYVMDADGKDQRPLTDGPTFDFGASFSTDGQTIVFCRDRDGVCHLWVMNADGSNPEPLTDDLWFDCSPTFSPDGKQIVFNRMERGQIHLNPPADDEELSRRFTEVYVMNSDGTNQHRLTHNGEDDMPIAYSANGARIFFRVASRTLVMDSDGSNVQDLGQGHEQSLSLDGQRIVFDMIDRQIGIMNADGTGRRAIYQSPTRISNPIFTPDGAHVVFVEWPEIHGAGTIKILDLQTTKTETAPGIQSR